MHVMSKRGKFVFQGIKNCNNVTVFPHMPFITDDVVPVARLEDFRAQKSSKLEAFRALSPYDQIGGF